MNRRENVKKGSVARFRRMHEHAGDRFAEPVCFITSRMPP